MEQALLQIVSDLNACIAGNWPTLNGSRRESLRIWRKKKTKKPPYKYIFLTGSQLLCICFCPHNTTTPSILKICI
jgi:hypothetical protein